MVFKDVATGEWFITRSCVATKETIEIDGKEYPLYKMEVSSYSHPFFTGKMRFVDTERRIEKFMKKYEKYRKKLEEQKKGEGEHK